jgi:3-oxo-5-alpha-steroid 4-dehydrogenase 3 / polyprenol reductase
MEAFEFVVDSLLSISPAQCLQAFYVLGTASILFIHALPADLRSALVEYGARQQTAANKSVIALVVKFAQVPHSWFLHFYILSVGLSLFWGWQYVTKGDILSSIVWAQVNGPGGDGPSMDISQVFVAWGLLAAQGARRLFENIFVMAPGKSHMSILHWVFGITFYTAMSMSMWIEGSGRSQICYHLKSIVPCLTCL